LKAPSEFWARATGAAGKELPRSGNQEARGAARTINHLFYFRSREKFKTKEVAQELTGKC